MTDTTNFESVDNTTNLAAVVDVYVARYEKALHEQHRAISGRVKNLKKDLADLRKAILQEMEDEVRPLFANGPAWLEQTVQMGDITTDKHNNMSVTVSVSCTANSIGEVLTVVNNSYYRQSEFTFNMAVNGHNVASINALERQIDEEQALLMEVLNKINSINSKERELRGAIAERSLAEKGLSNLITDASLMKLIDLSGN